MKDSVPQLPRRFAVFPASGKVCGCVAIGRALWSLKDRPN